MPRCAGGLPPCAGELLRCAGDMPRCAVIIGQTGVWHRHEPCRPTSTTRIWRQAPRLGAIPWTTRRRWAVTRSSLRTARMTGDSTDEHDRLERAVGVVGGDHVLHGLKVGAVL